MISLADWPLKRKLSAIVLLTSGILISAMAVFVVLEKYYSFRINLRQDLAAVSEIIGSNSTAALSFQDPATGQESLDALAAKESIIAACLLDSEGQLFALYTNPAYADRHTGSAAETCPIVLPEIADQTAVQEQFSPNEFSLKRPILLNKRVIGQILICTDLSGINAQITYFILVLAGLIGVLFLVGLAICSKLNTMLVGPISRLAETMRQVRAKEDFSFRVIAAHRDEVGLLINGFNDMLDQIEHRERELDRHRSQLEKLVHQQTEELQTTNTQLRAEIEERKEAQEKLAHAQKMEAIGTLAGGVAHDLNNILSGVVSYPDLLLTNLPPDSAMRRPLETIKASGDKAAAIVQDLLTLARRGVKVKSTVELNKLIQTFLNSPECQNLLADHGGVAVSFAASPEPVHLLGSPLHLEKTIMNLVSNAAEAMPAGGTITISTNLLTLETKPPEFEAWRPGGYVALEIADTGIGISAPDLDKIFEPFYSRKVMGKSGTGLGMAVVWGTIEDHNGMIEVSSVEGRGTTFRILLPVEEDSAQMSDLEQTKQDIPTGKNERVLVVDDSEQQRLIATELLTHLGYSAVSVESGEAAITYLHEHEAELILLDMLMEPGINGLETFKRIKAMRPRQKAIIASGFSSAENVQEAFDLGVMQYIKKPYSLTELAISLRNCLR